MIKREIAYWDDRRIAAQEAGDVTGQRIAASNLSEWQQTLDRLEVLLRNPTPVTRA
jgi:hypothetical protein